MKDFLKLTITIKGKDYSVGAYINKVEDIEKVLLEDNEGISMLKRIQRTYEIH